MLVHLGHPTSLLPIPCSRGTQVPGTGWGQHPLATPARCSQQPKAPQGLAVGGCDALFLAAQAPASSQALSAPAGSPRAIRLVAKYKPTHECNAHFKKKRSLPPTPKQNPTSCTGGSGRLGSDGSLRPSPVAQRCAAPRTHTSTRGPFFMTKPPRIMHPKSLFQCLSQTWALCAAHQALSQAQTLLRRLHQPVNEHRPCCVLSPACLQHRWAVAAVPAVRFITWCR